MVNWRKVFSLPARGAVDPMRIHKVLGVGSSTVAAWAGGSVSGVSATDLSGNGRTATLTSGPTIGTSNIQGADGNRLQSIVFDGANDHLLVSTGTWQDIFDQDHAFTCVVNAHAFTGDGVIIKHSSSANDGLYFYVAATTGIPTALYRGAGGSTVSVAGPAISVGQTAIITLVRRSNVATVYVNGVAGTPKSVSGYGVDGGTPAIYLGAAAASTDPFDGYGVYWRLNNAALTDAQIQREFMMWAGAGLGTTWGPSLDFSRAGTAYQTYSDGTMALRSSGMPRVGDGVLVEGAVTNLFSAAYQRNVDAGWGKNGIQDTHLNTHTGPDGTAYLDTIHESATNDLHAIYQNQTLTNGVVYTVSFIAQPAGRNFAGIAVYPGSGSSKVAFDLLTYGTNTISGTQITNLKVTPMTGGNVRISANITGDGTSTQIMMGAAESLTSVVYDGDVTKGIAIGDMVLETGSFPTSIPDPSTGTRVADDLSIPTYRLRNTLKDVITTAPTMWLDFTQDPSGATITDNSGTYTLTKAGQPKRYTSPVYGDYHLFGGSSDYYTSSSSAFNPAWDFSVVAVYTPATTAAGTYVIASKWNSTGNQRGWMLYQDGSGLKFARSTDGASGTMVNNNLASCLVAGKPSLITATYAASTGLTLRVDALTPDTDAATAGVHASTANFIIGAEGDLTNKINGRLHYLAYYDGTILSATDHSNMYAALKLPGILPTKFCGTTHSDGATHYSKLRVVFENKGQYSSSSNIGTTRALFGIKGEIGSATYNKNNLIIYTFTDGKIYASFFSDGSTTERYIASASAYTNLNSWKNIDLIIDFANLANSSMTIDGVSGTLDANMTGTDKKFSLLDTAICVGKGIYTSTTEKQSYSHIRNLEMMIA